MLDMQSCNERCHEVFFDIMMGGQYLTGEDMLRLRQCCAALRRAFTIEVVTHQLVKDLLDGMRASLTFDHRELDLPSPATPLGNAHPRISYYYYRTSMSSTGTVTCSSHRHLPLDARFPRVFSLNGPREIMRVEVAALASMNTNATFPHWHFSYAGMAIEVNSRANPIILDVAPALRIWLHRLSPCSSCIMDMMQCQAVRTMLVHLLSIVLSQPIAQAYLSPHVFPVVENGDDYGPEQCRISIDSNHEAFREDRLHALAAFSASNYGVACENPRQHMHLPIA